MAILVQNEKEGMESMRWAACSARARRELLYFVIISRFMSPTSIGASTSSHSNFVAQRSLFCCAQRCSARSVWELRVYGRG